MQHKIPLEYYVSYGKIGGSNNIPYEFMLREKEYAAYLRALVMGDELEYAAGLEKAVDRACREICRYEKEEYDTDVEEEGTVHVVFALDSRDLKDAEIEEAVFYAVKSGDSEYLRTIFEELSENYSGDLWAILARSIQEYKKPALRKLRNNGANG